MQLAATFSVPPSNHLIDTSGYKKFTSLTVENGLIQSIRFAICFQNASGFVVDCE